MVSNISRLFLPPSTKMNVVLLGDRSYGYKENDELFFQRRLLSRKLSDVPDVDIYSIDSKIRKEDLEEFPQGLLVNNEFLYGLKQVPKPIHVDARMSLAHYSPDFLGLKDDGEYTSEIINLIFKKLMPGGSFLCTVGQRLGYLITNPLERLGLDYTYVQNPKRITFWEKKFTDVEMIIAYKPGEFNNPHKETLKQALGLY
jgi:hypothetical protein